MVLQNGELSTLYPSPCNQCQWHGGMTQWPSNQHLKPCMPCKGKIWPTGQDPLASSKRLGQRRQTGQKTRMVHLTELGWSVWVNKTEWLAFLNGPGWVTYLGKPGWMTRLGGPGWWAGKSEPGCLVRQIEILTQPFLKARTYKLVTHLQKYKEHAKFAIIKVQQM